MNTQLDQLWQHIQTLCDKVEKLEEKVESLEEKDMFVKCEESLDEEGRLLEEGRQFREIQELEKLNYEERRDNILARNMNN